jgi:hypothetical protein
MFIARIREGNAKIIAQANNGQMPEVEDEEVKFFIHIDDFRPPLIVGRVGLMQFLCRPANADKYYGFHC